MRMAACFIGFYRDVHVNLFIWVFPKIGVDLPPKMDGEHFMVPTLFFKG